MGDIRGRGLAKREQLGVKQRKLSVRAAATGNLTGITATTKSITNSTHTDGVTLVRGDRFLAPHQTTGALNGVFVVTDIVSTTVYLDRADDWRDPGDVTCGTEVYVEEGTVNKGKLFRVSTVNPIVIGTTALVFAVVASGGMGVVGGAGGITAKRLVYVSGYDATYQQPLVLHADATSATAGARKAFFYAPSAIAAGAQGLVFSEYYEAATGVGGGAADDPVYLSTTGTSTLTAPTAGGADRVSQIVGRIGSGGAGTCWYHLSGSPWDVIGTANIADNAITTAKIAAGTIIPADVDLTQDYDWTGAHTFDKGATPTTAIQFKKPAAAASPGTLDSHDLQLQGASDDGGAHTVDWKIFNDVTSNAGASSLTFQNRVDAGAFATKFSVGSTGLVDSAACVPDTAMVSKIVKDIGGPAVGFISATGIANVGQTLTIGGVVHYTSAGGLADAGTEAEAIVAAINALPTRVVDAYTLNVAGDLTSSVVFIEMAATPAGASVAIVSTLANHVVSAAASTQEAAPAVLECHAGRYTVTGADVTALALGTNPYIVIDAYARSTATMPTVLVTCIDAAGVNKPLATVVTLPVRFNTNFWGLCVRDVGAVLAAGDVLNYMLIG